MGQLRIAEVTCASRFDEEEILATWWNVRMGSLKRPFSLGQYIHLVIRGADIYCLVDCNIVSDVETEAGRNEGQGAARR